MRGNGIKKTDTTDQGVQCVRYGEIYTIYNNWFVESKSHTTKEVADKSLEIKNGDVLMAITGETAEDIGKTTAYVGEERAVVGGDVAVLTKHGQNPKYISYFLNSKCAIDQRTKMATGHTVVHVGVKNLAKIKIPIPPLAEQERIVTILDKFDALVNDISIGLPAELDARRSQYEYYRGKLLTFDEMI